MRSLRRAAALVLALFVLATVLVGGGVYRAFAEGDLTAADFDNSSIKMVDSSGKDLPTNAKVDFKSTFGYVWKSQSKDGVSYNGKTIKIKAPDHWIFEPSTKELNKIVDPATGVTIATIEHNADGNEITITYVTDTAFKQELKLGLMTERKDPYWANIASGDIVSPVPLKPLAEGDQYSVTVHYDAPSPVDNMFQKRSVKYDAKKKEADFIVEIRTDVANGNTVDGHEVKCNEFIFFDTPQRGMQVADGSYMNLGTYNSVGGYGPDLYPEPGDTFVPSDENGTWLHPNRKVLDDGTIIEAYRIFYDMDEKGYPIYEDKTVALKDPETAAMFESAEVASVPKNLRIEPLGTPAKPGETSGVMYRIINNHQKHFYFYGKFSVFDESYITGESGGVPTMNNKASYYAQDLTNCDSTGKCSDPLVRKSNGSSTTDVRLVTGEVQGELIYDSRVKVNKVDAWGKPVPGAKFSISKYKSGLPVEDKDKKKVTNLVANAEGKLERIESDGTRTPLENIILPRTTLYLFEDEAPAGYTRMAEPLKLPIHTAETPEAAPTVTVTNEHEVGKVNVTKVDGADAPVAGAVFKLTKDAAGNEVAASYPQTDVPSVKLENLTSNAQGALEVEGKQLNTFNIETGTYYLHETSAPNNYESLTAPQKIVVTKDETNTVKVVNTRKAPKPVTISGDSGIKAQKTLNGRVFKADDSFEFVLAAKDGAPMPVAGGEKIAVTNGDPKAFGDIKFDKAGEYHYTVSETKGSAAGVTYDTTAKDVTVTVTDDNNGSLVATVAYAGGATAASFTNTYEPTPATISGESGIKAQKILDGRDFADGDSFEFVLSPKSDGAPMPEGTGNKVTVTNGTPASFGDIRFTKPGTYEYNVTETQGSAGGMTYDKTTKVVTVTVTDDGAGALSAKVSYPENASAATFTNKYTATSVELSGDTAIKAQKTLTGRDFKAGDTFEFVLSANGEAPMPAAGGEKITVTNGEPKGFGAITFTQPGTYFYNVVETKGSLPGVTYDEVVRQVEVTVTDNNTGSLNARVSYGEGETIAAFENTYKASTVTVSGDKAIKAQKVLTGREFKAGDSFEFVLTAKDGAPMPEAGGEKIAVSNGEPKSFGAISFDKAGTYKYEVAETAGNIAGVTYDKTKREVTIEVTDDGSGTLKAAVSYPDNANAAKFENTYKPTGVTIGGGEPGSESAEKGINVQKVLTGREWKDSDSFTFTLEPQNGAPAFAKTSVTTTKDAKKAGFGEATFDKAGTYTYLIKETVPADAANNVKDGVTYDTQTITATVTVTDDTNGHLVATATYSTGAAVAEFTNTYGTSAATITGDSGIKAKKVLEGREFKTGDTFTFTLEAISENAPMPAAGGEKITVSNGDPKAFGDIKFDKAGEYKYEVRETAGSAAGITYDSSAQEVTVTVIDTGKGTLEASVAYADETAHAATFTNTYKASATTITGADAIKAQKVLEGRSFKADDSFEFVLSAVDGAPMPASGGEKIIVTNGEAKSFGAISFDKAGAYTYNVKETAGSAAGITYDTTTKQVTVTVTDDGAGKLSAKVSYGADGVSAATFTNKYKATSVTIGGGEPGSEETNSGINVKKNLVGRSWKTGDSFTFTLEPQNGAPAFAKNSVEVTSAEPANFGSATFEQAGTYTYKIAETQGNIPGVTYATDSITATVTVTDDDSGKLAASVAYSTGAAQAEFTNTYAAGAATLSGDTAIKAQKELSGRAFKADDSFEFVLTAKDNAPMPAIGGEKLTVNNGEPKGFGAISYTTAGTYKYEVAETQGSAGGVTYDATKREVVVTVTDDGSGALKAEVSYPEGASAAQFKNTYTTTTVTIGGGEPGSESAEKGINVQKVLTGREWKDSDSFTFTLEPQAGAPAFANTSATATKDAKKVGFGAATFEAAGTYTYLIKETVPAEAANNVKDGVTYDTQTITATVTVADDTNGHLVATTTYSTGGSVAEFKNTYTAGAATLTGDKAIKAQKELSGRAFKADDSFEFVLTAKDNAPMPAIGGEKLTVNNGEPKGFGAISYTTAGTYKYEVAETKGSAGGVTYDANKREVVVNVTDDGNGALSATVSYPEGTQAATFTNTYEAAEVELSADANNLIRVQKTLTGRAWKQGDSFTFTATPENGAPALSTSSVTVTNDQPAAFGRATYTKAGTYTYEIAETAGNIGGIAYDTNKITAKVTVEDNGEGKLVATTTYSTGSDKAEFVNTYGAGAATITGDSGIKAKKTLTGREFKTGDSFEFVLTAKDNAPMPAAGGDKISVSNGDPKSFGAISYTKAGTYKYEVRESAGTVPGVTYSDAVREVTVTVTDNGEGNLVAEVSGTAEFTNTYKAAEVELSADANNLIRAQKVLVGRDFKAGDTFTFTATPQNGAPALEKASVTVTNGEVADFGKATYVQAGTYTYEIAETAGAIPGVTYDTNKIIATVTVADNGEGKLVATTTYSNNASVATFTNTYTAGAATLTGDKAIKVQKELSGREFKADDSFEFVLTAKDGAPMPEAGGEKITINNGDPKSFGAISFDKAGTYKYEVKETAGNIAGVTYSTDLREVVVNVTDDGNGLLAAEVVYANNASAATFTNTYTATSVTIGGGEPGSESAEKGINVQKVLTGREWKDSDSFTFTLEPQNGAPAFANTSVTATKDAKKAGFGAATFDKAGTYTYKIAETAGTLGGITYDTNTITATVTVADDTNGHLVATTTYSNNASVATFTNTYTAGAATITGDSGIKVKKVLSGRDFKAGDAFEFVLTAKDGAPMPAAGGEKLTVTNAEPVSFGSINYTQAGTYKYEVRETAGTTPGVTYDTSVKEITVTVTDDGNGALVAEVSGVAEFENTYTATAATLDAEHGLRVQKTLEGRAWRDTDAFEFVVEPVDGAPAPEKTRITATNTEAVSFGAMQFDHAGTYLYRISEVAGTEAGMTYDTMVVTARVEVVDDTEGHLLATVSYSNGTATAEFVNTYTEPRASQGDNDGNGNNNGGRRTSRKLPAAGDTTGIPALITGAAGLVAATLGRVTKRQK